MSKSLLTAMFFSLAISSMLGESATAGGTLTVDRDAGIVGYGVPCPKPRTSAIYSELRSALRCAKSGDTIEIAPGRHFVSRKVDDRHSEGIDIDGDIRLRIIGSGPNQTVLQHGAHEQVGISVWGAHVNFERLTMSQMPDGAVSNFEGVVVIKNCVFVDSGPGFPGNAPAVSNDGGRMKIFDTVFAGNLGGAITNSGDGNLHLVRTTIVGNEAASGGGINNADNAALTVVRSMISGNDGAGIYNSSAGRVILRRTVLEGNYPEDCFGCP